MRGKGKTLLKKGFSPFPAPLSPFLKLLLLQAVYLFSGRTNDNLFHRAACRRTRYRKAQTPFDRLASAASRLHKACCTACITCTTAAALNAGREFRLLMPVGRAAFSFSRVPQLLVCTRHTLRLASLAQRRAALNAGSEFRLLAAVGATA